MPSPHLACTQCLLVTEKPSLKEQLIAVEVGISILTLEPGFVRCSREANIPILLSIPLTCFS